MLKAKKENTIAEFGDFQTPADLAQQVCALLHRVGVRPSSIIEPTCGLGNFLLAALDQFPSVEKAVGVEINADYANAARASANKRQDRKKIQIIQGDFFNTDWDQLLQGLTSSVLVIGNPPWVTSAQLGILGSDNLPEKSNFQGHRGLDARTGKSNFDISEWMMIRILHWLNRRKAALGMLCKTAVARKILSYAWKNHITLAESSIHHIDAATHFEASVDACLLLCRFSPAAHNFEARVFERIEDDNHIQTIGLREGRLTANIDLYEKWSHLEGVSSFKWRSGIKHDCSKIMELVKDGHKYRNGLGETVDIEDSYVFPMLKSSNVANVAAVQPKRWMIVTQKSVRDDTALIKEVAPKTWAYLQAHGAWLDKRGSSIYKNRPRFSIFGVGDYSYAPWKVAISGFYKKLSFKVVGPFIGKPVMLDDTCYFLPCQNKEEATYLASLLNSQPAREFFQAFIFWDAKRPITSDLLNALDIEALATCLGSHQMFARLFGGIMTTQEQTAHKLREKIPLFT